MIVQTRQEFHEKEKTFVLIVLILFFFIQCATLPHGPISNLLFLCFSVHINKFIKKNP